MRGDCPHPRMLDFTQQPFKVMVPVGMVIMVEDNDKVVKKVINEAVEVEEMVCNQAGKWLVKMIGLSFMLFWERMRKRHLMR